jgi:hypothetical protein
MSRRLNWHTVPATPKVKHTSAGMVRMHSERLSRWISVAPTSVRRWAALGYEVDSDPRFRPSYDPFPLNGKPNDWELRAPLDVHKMAGR